jgi:hypothetical protein
MPNSLGCNAKPDFGHGNDCLVFGLKQRFRKLRLPNDNPQGPASDWVVKRNRNGYGRCFQTLLHDPVAALLADCCEAVLFENPTRSLPNRHLNLSDKNLVAKAAVDFGRGG